VSELRVECTYVAARTIGDGFDIDEQVFDRPIRHTDGRYAVALTFPLSSSTATIVRGGRHQPTSPTRLHAEARTALATDEAAENEKWRDIAKQALFAVEDATSRLMDTVRAAQPWSGLIGSVVEIEDGPRLHIDYPPIDLQMGRPHRATRPLVRGGPRLTVEQAEAAVGGSVPNLGRTFLAEALWSASISVSRRPSQAVVLAAVACEVSAKTRLRELADPKARPLLDVLVDNVRGITARDLFHHVPQALIGRSLRTEDRELWKKIDRLFEKRNQVVHVGASVSEEEANELAWAASNAVRWLDWLRPC
jgi:hypothetical protein